MKQIKYILPLFLAVMLSCSKETTDTNEPETPGTATPAFTLTASIGNDVTKTALGQESDGKYPVSWTAGDKISVNGIESGEAAIGDADAKTATFAFDEALEGGTFKAVYPASAWKSDGVITVPATQTYNKDTFDPASAIMAAYSEDAAALNFKHLMTYLVLSFDTESDPDPIKTITLKSRGSEPMSGDFTVDFQAESSALAPASDAVAAAVTVNCGEGVALGTEVVVAVPAQTYASGIEITTTDTNGDKTVHVLKQSFKAVSGTVYLMPITFELYPGSRQKPVRVGDLLWAPVYCGYSNEHPNGLLYQYGRAVGQPYYPAASGSSIVKAGPVQDPADGYFYKGSKWYSGTALTSWPMSASEAGYVEGKIANPCPSGWRIPTIAELDGLLKIGFTQSTNWAFSGDSGVSDAQKEMAVVNAGFTLNGDSGLFFAAVGGRAATGNKAGQAFYRSNGQAYARVWASDRNNTDMTKASCLSLQRKTDSVELNGFDAKIRNDYTVAGGISVRCVKDAK